MSDLYSFWGSNEGYGAQQALRGYQSFILEAVDDTDPTNTAYFSDVAPGDFKTDIVSRRIASKSNNFSNYSEEYSKSLKSANRHVKNAMSPEIVSKLIYDIINSKNPKIHYKVGKFIQKFSIVLKMILPDRLFEKILLNYSKN